MADEDHLDEVIPLGITRRELNEILDAMPERLAARMLDLGAQKLAGREPSSFSAFERILMDLVAEREAEAERKAGSVPEEVWVSVGNAEASPWGNDRSCPKCGEQNLPLKDSVPPLLTYISHCGQSWLRGPIG